MVTSSSLNNLVEFEVNWYSSQPKSFKPSENDEKSAKSFANLIGRRNNLIAAVDEGYELLKKAIEALDRSQVLTSKFRPLTKSSDEEN